MAIRSSRVMWALVFALCAQAPTAVKANGDECVPPPGPSATSVIGELITNPISDQACPDNQEYVADFKNEIPDANDQEGSGTGPRVFVNTTAQDPNQEDNSANEMEGSYMILTGTHAENSSNRIPQVYLGDIYYSNIVEFIPADEDQNIASPQFKVSGAETVDGKPINPEWSNAGVLLDAYTDWDTYVSNWMPW